MHFYQAVKGTPLVFSLIQSIHDAFSKYFIHSIFGYFKEVFFFLATRHYYNYTGRVCYGQQPKQTPLTGTTASLNHIHEQ
jgi:hypothetical protein